MAMNWVPGDGRPARPAVLAAVITSLAVGCSVLAWLDSDVQAATPATSARTAISAVAGATDGPAISDGRIRMVMP